SNAKTLTIEDIEDPESKIRTDISKGHKCVQIDSKINILSQTVEDALFKLTSLVDGAVANNCFYFNFKLYKPYHSTVAFGDIFEDKIDLDEYHSTVFEALNSRYSSDPVMM